MNEMDRLETSGLLIELGNAIADMKARLKSAEDRLAFTRDTISEKDLEICRLKSQIAKLENWELDKADAPHLEVRAFEQVKDGDETKRSLYEFNPPSTDGWSVHALCRRSEALKECRKVKRLAQHWHNEAQRAEERAKSSYDLMVQEIIDRKAYEQAAYQKGRITERAKIVTWLRESAGHGWIFPDKPGVEMFHRAAAKIENWETPSDDISGWETKP